jgi:hypothetical protein
MLQNGGSTPPVNPNAISAENMSAVVPTGDAMIPTEITGQNDTKEATQQAIEEVKEAAKSDDGQKDSLSNQYAQLARREKALRAKALQQEQALKAKEAEIAAKEAALRAQEEQYKNGYISKQRLKEQTLEALAEADISYDAITQQLINSQTSPQDPRLTAHIAKLEAKIAELENNTKKSQEAYEEQQSAAYKAAVAQIKTDVSSLVATDPAYETIRYTGSEDEVVRLIEEVYNNDGVLMTVEEAAAEVEKELEERMYKVLSKTEKLKKRLVPATQPATEEAKAATQKPQETVKQQQTMKTLTNTVTGSRKLTARERAILAMKGELK